MPRPDRSAMIDVFLTQLVRNHPRDLVAIVAEEAKVSRTAVVARVRNLIAEGQLVKEGTTRPIYRPGPKHVQVFVYEREGLEEDRVWRKDVLPLLRNAPQNVIEIAQYGLTEMVNNAVDHSEGRAVVVCVHQFAESIKLAVSDNGAGIFAKISRALELPDQRLALLELSKGKLTTDPSRHSGEGIFFTSRMFDTFQIISGGLLFSHDANHEKDILLEDSNPLTQHTKMSTIVKMCISMESKRLMEQVFAEYSSGPDEYAFSKTVVPVRMAKLGDENLVSRSQAKRVLQGVHRFRHIVFDFASVGKIGQAFADEIFRVFAIAHPDIEIEHIHATPEVQQMIRRAEVLRDENATNPN